MSEKISQRIKSTKKKVVEHTWVIRAVKFGYVIRGLVYFLAGIFGMQLALGLRANGTNLTEVIIAVAGQGLGKIFLILVVLGLTCYSLWGFLRGGLNVLGKKNDLSGWLNRFGFLVSAVSYGSLALAGWSLWRGISVAGNSNDPSVLSAKVLAVPFGQQILIVVGICWVLGAFSQIILGFRAGFKKDLKIFEWRGKKEQLTMLVGKFGIISRSLILGIVGIFIVRAGILFNSGAAIGTGEVFAFLKNLVFGQLIVSALSIGLMMFGAFSIISARYLKFPEE